MNAPTGPENPPVDTDTALTMLCAIVDLVTQPHGEHLFDDALTVIADVVQLDHGKIHYLAAEADSGIRVGAAMEASRAAARQGRSILTQDPSGTAVVAMPLPADGQTVDTVLTWQIPAQVVVTNAMLRALTAAGRLLASSRPNGRVESGRRRWPQVRSLSGAATVLLDETGMVLTWDEAAEDMFGISAHQARDRKLADVITIKPAMTASEAHHRTSPEEVVAHRSNGEAFPVEISLMELHGSRGRLIRALIDDITARKTREQQLLDAATHDPLTGAPNRAAINQRLEYQLLHAVDTRPFGVILIDLNDFKLVNDTHGHQIGDRLLEALARRMTAALRPQDMLGRISGDEFVAITAPLDNPDDIGDIAARLADAFTYPVNLADVAIGVSASIGHTTATPGTDLPDAVLDAADEAMYDTKRRIKTNR